MDFKLTAMIALAAGTLFGVGLALSGMTDPIKVIGFLDISGIWQPTLAFVMGAALLVSGPVFALCRRRGRPLLASKFHLPVQNDIDGRLMLGSAIFGIGWGVAGFCPGPAIALLMVGSPLLWLFCGAMIAGMWMADRVASRSE